MMKMIDFGRLITAMVTPFDENGEVNHEEAARVARHLIQTGTETIVVAGTTGEGPTLTKEEKMALFKTVKVAAGNRAKVIANIGTNNTKESMEFARIVEKETEVDGLLVVNPYYNKPNQRGLYEHFKTIAESTKLPIMLYNIPGRTSVNLEAETTIALSKIPNIVAIKESTGNLDQMSKVIEKADDSFVLYSGDDNMTLPALSIGAYGVVSVASHFFGKEIKQMIETKDANIHRNLLDFFHVIFSDTNPVPTKFLLNQGGISVGGCRLPLVDADDKTKQKILHTYVFTKKRLETIGIH